MNNSPEKPAIPQEYSQAQEQELVQCILQGDKALFKVLVERYQGALWSLGMGFFRNGEDSRDFVQEVFIKVYRNLSSFEGRSRFSTWLYRIAYNTAINSVKRKREYLSLAEDFDIPDTDTPERQAMRAAGKMAVQEALKKLPERYRICIDLFFFHDLSYPEIEKITGFPVNTIKSHVFRAKQQLRKSLDDFSEGD